MKSAKASRFCTPLLVALIAGAVSLQTASAVNYLWNVSSPDFNNWNVAGNWTPSGNPGAADTVTFGEIGVTDSTTVNNVVSVNTTVTSLKYTNTTLNAWHITQIPAGVTLRVTNLTVGGLSGDNMLTSVAMTGAGTLMVHSNLTVGNNGISGDSSKHMFNLSTLSNFVFSATNGIIQLCTGNRSGAEMNLAASSNHITAGSLLHNTLSTSSTPVGTNTLALGWGTNIINVGNLDMGWGRGRARIKFPKADGGLRLRGVGGTDLDRANMVLGYRNTGGSGGNTYGGLLLTGHWVDLKIGTLTNGMSGGTGSGNNGKGEIQFDNGIIEATSISMARNEMSIGYGTATGIIFVGTNATLVVGSGGMSLANLTSSSNLCLAYGTLNIDGGTVICSNSITKANALANGVGTISVTNGVLRMAGGVIGTPDIPIDNLNLQDSTLTLAVSPYLTNVVVTTLTSTSTTNNRLNISAVAAILSYPVTIPLIRYANGSSDLQLGSLPAGYTGYLSSSAGAVDLVISSGPVTVHQLVWNGTPTGDWNTNTLNWLYLGNPLNYSSNDYVTFNDTASGTTAVNLTTNLWPGTLMVSNNSKTYTFSGTGSLEGSVALVKAGSGTLTIGNSGTNAFTGGVSIQGGTVRLGGSADRLPTSTTVTLADVTGAQLDLNNLNQTIASLNGGGLNGGNVALGSATLTVWSGGFFGGVISGTGQLIKTNYVSGGTLTLSNGNTYSGGTIIGGYTSNTTLAVANWIGSGTGTGFVRVLTNGTLMIGNNTPCGSVEVGVITNEGVVQFNRSDDFTFPNVITGTGRLFKNNTNLVILTVTNYHTGGTSIDSAEALDRMSTLRLGNAAAAGSTAATIEVGNRGNLQLSNNITLLNPVWIASRPSSAPAAVELENAGGTNTLAGPLTLSQNGARGWLIGSSVGRLVISGPMLKPATTSQNTQRPLTLKGDADGEWRGSIIDPVGGTTNMSLIKDGPGTWTFSGTNTYTGPTTVSNGTLLVNGSLAASTAVTVLGGTLGGTGVINGPVVVNGGSLAPGASIGTLTINNTLNLSLATSTIMEVSHSVADKVAGISTLYLGGTLQIITNSPLRGGEVFKLFAATSYSGNFSSCILPALPGSLGWDTNTVNSDGIIRVTGTGPAIPPVISGFSPTIGNVGTSVILTGSFFTGATSVKFNGTTAPGFVVNSDSQITVTVPAGATTGTISVTTADGTGTSTGVFTVGVTAPTIAPPTVSGTNLVISVPTVSGASYVLQSATNLTPTVSWKSEVTNAGTGGTVIFIAPIDPAKQQKYLRVWVY